MALLLPNKKTGSTPRFLTLRRRSLGFPKLPVFKKYDAAVDYYHYESHYAAIEPVSDFSPNNVTVWLNIGDDLHIAEDHHNLVLQYSCPFLGNETVFSVIGTHNAAATFANVFDYQKNHGFVQELTMIPEGVIKTLANQEANRFEIIEDTENFDYIYKVSEKADLSRTDQAKFRRTINRFIRDYGEDVTIRNIELTSDYEMNKLVNALHVWKSGDVVSNNDKLNIEGVAIDRYLKNRQLLKPRCVQIFLDGVMIGFSIYHYPPQGSYAIINHIKCNYNYQNIFDFTFFCVMNQLNMAGITYANGEQDLGVEGIRNYKHKLGPCAYIKRYTVRPRLGN